VDDVICAPRPTHSSNAKRITENQYMANHAAEKDGIDIHIDDLLFSEQISGRGDGIQGLSRKAGLYLDRAYLPKKPSPSTTLKGALKKARKDEIDAEARAFGPLEQPRPDTTLGYLIATHYKCNET
jgi:hypothetical protein